MSKPVPWKFRLLRQVGNVRFNFRGRDRLLMALCPPDAGRDLPFEIKLWGMPYRGNLNNVIDWAAYFYGGHAKSELALLKRMAVYLGAPTAKFTYLDIGTNVGQHVLFMSPLVDRVVGFEPVEHLRRQALDNLALRGIQNAEILGCALGEKAERRDIFINLGLNHSSSLLADFSAENSRVGTSIEVVKGDEVIHDREIARVKIVKIDVEGFEPWVCRGLSETFNRDRPFVLIELWNFNIEEFAAAGAFPDSIYSDAAAYELIGKNNGRYQMVPYEPGRYEPGRHRFAEVVVIPRELQQFVALNGYCRYLD